MEQDWEPVIFKSKKPLAKKPSGSSAPVTMSGATGKPAFKIEQMVDSESGGSMIQLVSQKDAQAVIQGRVAKKWSQKQLAQALNVQEKVIKDIESRKVAENKALLGRIKRVLA